jgi:hypothetical protein
MNNLFLLPSCSRKGSRAALKVVKNKTVVQEILTHVPYPVASNNDETGRVASSGYFQFPLPSLFYMIAICQVVPVNHEISQVFCRPIIMYLSIQKLSQM